MYDYYEEQQKQQKKSSNFLPFAFTIFLIIVGLIAGVNVYLKVIQLNEAGGYSFVYLTNLKYMVLFAASVFVLVFLVVTANTIFIKKNLNKYIKENALPAMKLPFLSISFASAFMAVLFTNNDLYKKVIPFLNAVKFNKETPIVGGDIGYFIFQRPFLMSIYSFAMGLSFFLLVYTIIYYGATLLNYFSTLDSKVLKVKSFIRHIIINVAILFIIKALSFTFDKEGIVYRTVVNSTGASYVDVNIWGNFFKIAPYLTVAIVLVTLFFVWKGKLKNALVTVAIFPVAWVVVIIAAVLVQSVIVKPNEIEKEKEYLKYSIENTRAAYGLDKIQTINVGGIKELTSDVVKKNYDTVSNIQIVDYEPTLQNNNQIQSNTTFYTFNDGDVVSYNINNKETPVLISAREVDTSKIKDNSYINTMYKFTHGYGIVINPLNRITAQGQVDFIMSGLVMNSSDKNLKVKEPRIYYGEITNNRVIVNAEGTDEIDADGNTSNRYAGKGGIKLSLFNRLLYSAKYADPNLLISSYVTSESKMLVNRNVTARVKMIAPFLEVDKDPYMVLTDDGRLKWVVDAYTYTNNYPFSQHSGNFNYIRNSVKAVVDAYDGDVALYVIDKEDPLVKVWQKAYPKLFSDKELPKDIASHAVYPENLFILQTKMMNRYHLDPNVNPENVNNFYYNQDIWDIAKAPRSETGSPDSTVKADADPYYNFIKLPGVTNKEELILMRPFTPLNKDNMVAWMAVRNSFDNYGEMVLYTFPKNTNIYGPFQVEASINSIDKVSKDISLWGQSGSRVFKGSLLVVPVEDSILYVEPIYVQASGPSSIPQVREVVIGYQKEDEFIYGIGANLTEAINDLYKGAVNTEVNKPTTPPAQENKPADIEKEKALQDLKNKLDSLKKQIDDINKIIEGLPLK